MLINPFSKILAKLLLTGLCLTLVVEQGLSQSLKDIIVNGRFENMPIGEIAGQLLEDQELELFVSDNQLVSQRKSLVFQETPLLQALTELFQGTPVNFVVYRNYAVIVGPRSKIDQSYDAEYYRHLSEVISVDPDLNELIIGQQYLLQPLNKVTIKGSIQDDLTGEKIVGASIILADSTDMTVSDAAGNFTLRAPAGKQTIQVQFIGYDQTTLPVRVFSDDTITINVSKNVLSLEEVTIEAVSEDANIESMQVGVERVDMKGITKIPVFMGEVDIERVLLLQPGVSKIAEGSAGFNVRGGEVDQNLIMQDEGIILNSSHALGFLSTFNPDMVQSVELYKGTMPAYFGGRLASTLDVKSRNGDFERFRLKAGISPITGRLNIETPVIRGTSSLNVGMRYNYADLFLKLGTTPDVRQSSSFFYDGQARYAHKLNDDNSLEFSVYYSSDEFRYSNDFAFDYQTLMGQGAFKSQINSRLFSNLSLIFSDYTSSRQELDESTASQLDNSVNYFKVKEHLTYTFSESLRLDGGLSGIYYDVDPGSIKPTSETSAADTKELESEHGLEGAVFVHTEWSPSNTWSISAGLRGVLYQYRGPKSVYQYAEGMPRSVENIVDTVTYTSGEVIESYGSLEPRISIRYRLNTTTALKAGYGRTAQFMNQISNFTAPTPASVWQLSNEYVEPTRAHNFSLGLYKNFTQNLWETSAEVYYRAMEDIIEYRDFADLNVNDHLETELLSGLGRSYGLELSIKKKRGVFNGWLSYTLSRTERKVDEVNEGAWYLSNLDKTHDLSLVGIFDINERHSITINFNYATGRPITAPVGSYLNENGLIVPVYSERNEIRVPDFHRLDISYRVGQGYNKSKKIKTSWIFSIYNLYGRKNPYSVFFVQKPFNFPAAKRFSVLGTALPSITFNIELL